MSRAEITVAIGVIRGQLDLMRSALGESVSDRDVRSLAEQFAAMDDDAQSKFFCEVAAIMDGWPVAQGSHGRSGQTWFIGRHLATCECSTESGRDFVREVCRAMENAL